MIHANKRIASFVLVATMLLSMTACTKKNTVEYFRDMLLKADVDATIANVKVSQNQVSFSKDNLALYACFDICKDEYAALTQFQNIYSRYEKGAFIGNTQSKLDKTFSYFTMNGETKDDNFSTVMGYYYGGWYCNKNVYAAVYTTVDSDSNRSEVDRILNALNYPKPQAFTNQDVAETTVTTSDSTTIQNKSTRVSNSKTTEVKTTLPKSILLTDLYCEDSSSALYISNDKEGKSYAGSFTGLGDDVTLTWKFHDGFVGYRTGIREYKKLKLNLYVGTTDMYAKKSKKASAVYIYADEKLLYTKADINSKTKTKAVSLDITGCKELKIRFCSNSVKPVIFEPTIIPE